MAPLWGSEDPCTRHQIPQRQWAGVTSHRFRPFVRAMGLIPCRTPRRSLESNGLAEAFFGSFKRDYVYQACLETVEDVGRQLPGVDRTLQSPGPAQRLGDAVASRVLCGVVSQKQDSTCPTLGGAVQFWIRGG